MLFAAGVSRITGSEMGYISCHDIRNGFKEIATSSTNESSHKQKKGFYRISRLDDSDVLVVSGWLDVHLYFFSSISQSFDKIVYLPTLHESKYQQ